MEYVLIVFFNLIVVLICSIVFYKKGVSDGKEIQIFYKQYNYKILIKSDKPEVDKKYRYYHWDMNVEQTIQVGDFISYNKVNMISALQKDYGTDNFKVVARRVKENDKNSQIFLIVNPVNKTE